jgi:hypothetical protein
VEPFFFELKFNASLSARILGVSVRFDSFPRSHAHLDSGHPGLGEDTFDGVLVAEMPFASLSPDVVQDEASKDVQGLSWVGEAVGVVSEVSRRVVLFFKDRFPKEDKGPIDVELHRSFPVVPYFLVSFPSLERPVAFEQAVFRGLLHVAVTDFTVW